PRPRRSRPRRAWLRASSRRRARPRQGSAATPRRCPRRPRACPPRRRRPRPPRRPRRPGRPGRRPCSGAP
ncbi:MAG: SAM-dependent methyltransferase, partial [Deltaproteobacteria bacterium]